MTSPRSELPAGTDEVARILMAAWEEAEGRPVNLSHVATFVDMAAALLRSDWYAGMVPAEVTTVEWSTDRAREHRCFDTVEEARRYSDKTGSPVVKRQVSCGYRWTDWVFEDGTPTPTP